MNDLPRLYSLADVCAATQYSADTIMRALKAAPHIRPIGKGRGIRFALEDYRAIVEALDRARAEDCRFEETRKILSKIRIGFGPKQQVYFVQSESGHIKIGVAVNPKDRLCALQNASPFRLKLLGCIPGGVTMERSLHSEFKAHRTSGEWFSPAPELLAKIEQLLSGAQ